MTNPPAGQRSMRRIAFASCIGTTVEFYDFFIFGTAAALVFSGAFFPALGPAAGTLASLATFGVAFVARPFGSMLFGHFGDRVGRKATLVASLLMMGLATFAIGLLPTAATIGVAAPILLIVLRLVQGLAVGGEWAGAVLLTGEHAPPDRRGTFAMFPQLGPSIALVLVSATFLLTSVTLTDEQFLAFGWRIPFLLSALLVIIGLYVRLKIEETPAFTNLTATKTVARAPFFEVLRGQPRELLLGAGSITMLFAFFHIGATYLTAYGTGELGLSRPTVLAIGIVAALFFGAATIVGATLSDRVGRRWVAVVASAVAIPWSLVMFPFVDVGTPLAFGVVTAVTLAIVGLAYGPAGAALPELFRSRYRYTGAGVAYSLAGVFGGAIPPLVATPLIAAFGTAGISVYLAALSLLSLVVNWVLQETREVDMTESVPERASA